MVSQDAECLLIFDNHFPGTLPDELAHAIDWHDAQLAGGQLLNQYLCANPIDPC